MIDCVKNPGVDNRLNFINEKYANYYIKIEFIILELSSDLRPILFCLYYSVRNWYKIKSPNLTSQHVAWLAN